MPEPLVVYTDLDGTLLDHFTYDWSAAAPMLARLSREGIPVVLVTSKVRGEVAELVQALDNPHPYIVENGAITVVPEGYFGEAQIDPRSPRQPVQVQFHGPTREQLTEQVLQVRERLGLKFRTFGELGFAGIAEHTGLSLEAAARADDREASEPLLWQEQDPMALTRFEEALAEHGLRCVRGGRFVHVLGPVDKARAVAMLHGQFERRLPQAPRRVVLGDGPNDLAMLAQADVAVVIPGHHGHDMTMQTEATVLRPSHAGPVGWAEAMGQILTRFGYDRANANEGD